MLKSVNDSLKILSLVMRMVHTADDLVFMCSDMVSAFDVLLAMFDA